jgi:hypothetical protein
MTPEQLQEIKDACEKATSGPWFVADGSAEGFDGEFDVVGPDNYGIASMAGTAQASTTPRDKESNATFIALARTALPDAIAELSTLKKLLAESNKIVNDRIGEIIDARTPTEELDYLNDLTRRNGAAIGAEGTVQE